MDFVIKRLVLDHELASWFLSFKVLGGFAALAVNVLPVLRNLNTFAPLFEEVV